MASSIGELQAAIWHTEEAIAEQEELLARELDPAVAATARRSLATLQDLLAIQGKLFEVARSVNCRTPHAHPGSHGMSSATRVLSAILASKSDET